MGGNTHMSFGVLFFLVIAGPISYLTGFFELTPLQALLGIGIGAVSGLLPDIDEPNAKLGRGSWMPRAFGPILRAGAVIISFPFRILGYVIKGTLGHRGGTHSLAMSLFFTLAFGILISMVFGPAGDWVILTIWLGYISHLFADSLNPSGVPLFWPMTSKNKTCHSLPKPLRIPTERPPNMRERAIKNMVILANTAIFLLFFVLLPLSNVNF